MMGLHRMVEGLETLYGTPPPPRLVEPLHLILWENVAYLVDDARREQAFEALMRDVGRNAEEILAAPLGAFEAVARLGGMVASNRIEKVRRTALLAQKEFGGDLGAVLKLPLTQAKKALQKFPSIGEPGAEKILLFCGAYPVLALDSNGLRALRRMGYGEEHKNYAATYRSVRDAMADELPRDCGWLIKAHQLLRQHGQQLCKMKHPLCGTCVLSETCDYFQSYASS